MAVSLMTAFELYGEIKTKEDLIAAVTLRDDMIKAEAAEKAVQDTRDRVRRMFVGNMLRDGFDVEKVAQMCEITVDEVESIKTGKPLDTSESKQEGASDDACEKDQAASDVDLAGRDDDYPARSQDESTPTTETEGDVATTATDESTMRRRAALFDALDRREEHIRTEVECVTRRFTLGRVVGNMHEAGFDAEAIAKMCSTNVDEIRSIAADLGIRIEEESPGVPRS